MNLVVDELDPQTKCLRLGGRLDLKGSGEIDLRFTSLTSTDASLIAIDMREVDFIASIGMRLLLTCAKAKAARGGRMVLFGLQPMVGEAMETAGIDSLIPIFPDESAALAGLRA
jgi:anti-anti-sigma factor